MSATDHSKNGLAPLKAIRRFDVIAEYSRQERHDEGYAEDEAKGYGFGLAKVLAARRFGKKSEKRGSRSVRGSRRSTDDEPKFRSVGDELQTDEIFDRSIIDRMGAEFYKEIFRPAIANARKDGESYGAIRDEIRKDWKTARSSDR